MPKVDAEVKGYVENRLKGSGKVIRTQAERLDALEQELAQQREHNKQLEARLQDTVATFSKEAVIEPGVQVVDDRTNVIGLKEGLVPFWPVKGDHYPNHPHNEAYAIARGYRAATPADFKEVDGVSPEERFALVTSRMHGHALFVIGADTHQVRKRQQEIRNAQASNSPMPSFRNPDGTNARVGSGVTEQGTNGARKEQAI